MHQLGELTVPQRTPVPQGLNGTCHDAGAAARRQVGYLLGLGDRHPSNLMLDRYSGKLLHIDFGDCFEASMHREKFPEKVPFRLTRMMVKGARPAPPRTRTCTCAGRRLVHARALTRASRRGAIRRSRPYAPAE